VPRVWVSLGSNIDRERCIRGAVAALRERYGALILSRVFESDAVGFEGQPFYNLVVGFDTEQPPVALCTHFRAIEDAFDRERGPDKFSPRTLDIDLLTYGDQATNDGGVALPRDEITRYAFVLGPLAEVAGDEVHAGSGRTYRALWEAFDRDRQPLRPVRLELE
jgi:2-amino-4-hydroxy-6-hydroxymethyldihydropteridine diphosphokinase